MRVIVVDNSLSEPRRNEGKVNRKLDINNKVWGEF